MSFPLPINPAFRKECIGFWLDDIDDRLEEAERCWQEANNLYLSLPPGCGDENLELRILQQRVKLDNLSHLTNENNQ